MPRSCFTTGWVVVLLLAVAEPRVAATQDEWDRLPFRCAEESRKRLNMEAVTIGGDIRPPKKLVDAAPKYPEPPARTKFSGIWIGEMLIGTDGKVVDAWAVREPKIDPPFPEFNQAIIAALKKWEYEPVTVDGRAVPVCSVVTVNIHF